MHLTAPPAFHPASSLLGRALRRHAADARQAESLYIVAAAFVVTAAMLIGQWGWMRWSAAPLAYGAALGAGSLLIAVACFAGWRPRLRVHLGPDVLEIQRGAEALALPLDQIELAERLPAEAFHRHWRRYAATRVFVNRLPAEVLLLRTAHGPVILGLPDMDLARLKACLDPASVPLVRAA